MNSLMCTLQEARSKPTRNNNQVESSTLILQNDCELIKAAVVSGADVVSDGSTAQTTISQQVHC